MKSYKGLRELICFLIGYILIFTALPVQAIAASNSNDTVINNDSSLVKEGDWLYYRNSSDGGSIYKIKIDGTQNTKINDISSCNINVNGDWIYFKSLSNDKFYEMYRIQKDGSKLQDLNFTSGGTTKIIGDYIYYRPIYDNYLNKVKIDGTENKKIKDCGYISDPSGLMAGGYVYYNKFPNSGGWEMFRCELDGSNAIQVFSDFKNGYIFKTTDNWIYIMQNDNTSETIYRVKPDGSQKNKIGSGTLGCIVIINDDWIYNRNENCFKKMDGSKVINEPDVTNATIINDRIYYHKTDDSFYSLKTDGTEKLKIYTSPSENSYNYQSFYCINDGNYIYYINDYKYGEKFLYKFDINSGTSEKLTPNEDIQKVSKDKQWTIKFNKKFDANTINDKNILVTDGDNAPIKMSITPNADGKSITMSKVPIMSSSWDNPFGNNPYWDNLIIRGMRGGKQIYNIKITQNVKDTDGHNLKNYVVKKFEISD